MATNESLWHRLLVAFGARQDGPAFLTRTDLENARVHMPAKQSLFARRRDQVFLESRRRQRAARTAAVAADYERECPYEEKSAAPVERLGRRGPSVSGGLFSLGKKR